MLKKAEINQPKSIDSPKKLDIEQEKFYQLQLGHT